MLSVQEKVPMTPRPKAMSLGVVTFLDFDRALNSIDDACELDQQSVTRGLDDATLSVRDSGFDQFVEMGVEPLARTDLVFTHETAITDYIGCQDCRKPSLDALLAKY